MAETKETVIFEVDVSSLTKSISEARTELDSYSAALAKSTEETGENSEATIQAKAAYDAQNKAVKQAEGSLLRLTQAEKSLGGSLKDVIKNYDASGKSIDQNRKVLNALTAEYIKTVNPSKEFTNRIKSISDELKKQEGAIGDTRRNVGNYKEAIIDAIGGISPGFSQAIGSIKGFNAAFSANPILGVVTALSLLWSILKQNSEAADVMKFAISGVEKGIKVFADILVDVVKGIGNFVTAIESPKDIIKGFGDLLKNQIINRFQAMVMFGSAIEKLFKGQFAEAAEIAANASIQLATGMKDVGTKIKEAVKEGYAAERMLDAMTTANAEAESAVRLTQISIDALTKSLKNRTKSEEERIGIATKIADLEIVNADRRVKIAQRELQAEELRLKNVARNGEDEARLIKLRTDVKAAESEKQIAISQKQTRIDILLDKQATDASKQKISAIEEDTQKAQEIADKALLDKIQRDQEEIESEDEKNRQIAQMRIEAMRQIDEAASGILASKLQSDMNMMIQFGAATMELVGTIGDAMSQSAENQIWELQDALDRGIISQEQFEKESSAIKLKAWKQSQAVAITQAVMNTANAVMAQLSNPTPYVGIVLAALAAATGAIQIGVIASQKPPKFADGGEYVVGGRSHSQGGTQYVGEDGNRFEVEKGERIFVMKRTASERIGELSRWNMMFGGRSWTDSPIGHAALGGAITDGGFVARNSSENANSLFLVQSFAKQLIDGMPAPVVSVKEINKVQSSRNRSVGVSEL